MPVAESRFRVMASDAHVVVVDGPPHSIEFARLRLGFLQRAWSRFEPDSDVARLNQRPGDWVVIDPDTVTLLELAVHAWERTGGRFDPTILQALVAAGYAHSFEDPRAAGIPAASIQSAPSPGCTDIDIDTRGSRARLPAGVAFDPGGIGKGLAADLVTADLVGEGAGGVLVNIGGDLRARGAGPFGEGWVVAVEDPFLPASDLARIAVADGGLATSSPLIRRWTTSTGPGHHLIDPASGRPGPDQVASVTVVAGEAWWAEALAKAAFLAGVEAGCRLLSEGGVAGLMVDRHGVVHAAGSVGRFLL